MYENELAESFRQLRLAWEGMTLGDLARLCRNRKKSQRVANTLATLQALVWEARGEGSGKYLKREGETATDYGKRTGGGMADV